MKHISTLFITVVLFVTGCSLDDAHYVSIEELDYVILAEDGSYSKDESKAVVPVEGGSVTYKILSNGRVEVRPHGEIPEWMTVSALDLEQDGILKIDMAGNNGFRRGVTFDLCLDGSSKVVRIVAKQAGIVPFIKCKLPYRTVKGSEGSQVSFELDTNLPSDVILFETSYLTGEKSWVSEVGIDGNLVKMNVAANGADNSRKAVVSLSYTDSWNISETVELMLTQASSTDVFGIPKTFPELRALAVENGFAVEEDYTVSGIVISDCSSANMNENPCLSQDMAPEIVNTNVSASTLKTVKQVVDTTLSCRTAYFQSEDASFGFRIMFDDAADNNLSHGMRITLSLAGTRLVRENAPERYTIDNVRKENILESTSGAAVPEKLKSISELSDSDLYTYVGIRNVEFPVKEGSYTDIRENHALWSPVNDLTVPLKDTKRYFYMDGYANMLVDGDGNSICVPINMLCRWRKPQAGIPQGAGTAFGILTHDEIKRYGDAGKYQLRVIDERGFEGLSSKPNWTTLAGWDKGTLEPSYGNAKMTCEKPDAVVVGEHSYKSVTAETKRTCGISDEYRSIRVTSPLADWYVWDSDNIVSYNGMNMEFSTAGLSGSDMMVVFRFYAGRAGTASTYQGFPSHWCVEYSIDGENYTLAGNSDLSGKDYVHLRNIAFTAISLGGYSTPTTTSTCLGPSVHAFILPSEVFGKEKVNVRIRPYDNVLSALPSVFTDDIENSHVSRHSSVEDYVSFQDIFIKYR